MIIGLLWIWLSDRMLVWFGLTDDHGFLAAASKGTLFVVLTAVLIYWLVRREVAALRASESLLRAVVEGTTDAVFVKDASGRYLLANEATARFLGRPVAEVLGRDDLELFDRADGARLIASDRAIMAGDKAVTLEETLTAAGVNRTYQATKAPYRSQDGTLLGVIGISRDVTALKQAEAALRAERDRMVLLLDRLPVGCVVNTPDMLFTYWNPAAEKIFGYTAEEILGRSAYETIIPRTAKPVVDKVLGDVLTGGWNVNVNENSTRDGRTIECEWTNTPVLDAEGRTVSFLALVQDVTKQRQLAAILQENEERFRATFEQAAVGITHVDLEGRFLRVNRRFAEITGYQPGELSMRTFQQITHAEDLEPDEGKMRQLLAGEVESYAIEKRYLRPDEQAVWVNLTVSLRRDDHGQPLHFIAVIEDITARKQAELELREQEEQLRLVIEYAPAALAVFDTDMRYIVASRRWRTDFRIGDQPLRGCSHYELMPEVTDTWREAHRRGLAGEVVASEGERFVRRDGSIQWNRWEVRPWKDATGRIAGIAIFSEDITARTLAEAALKESEWRFRSVFVNAGTGIGITDASGAFLQCNPAYCEVLGRTEDELRDLPLYELIHPDDRAENMALMRQLASGQIHAYEVENRFLHQSGRAVWVRKVVNALIDQDGRAKYLIALVTDVTERRRAEQELRDSEARFRNLIEFLPDAVYLNQGGVVVYANRACVRLFGVYEPQELYGKSPFELIHPDYHDAIRLRMAFIRETRLPVSSLEEEIVRVDGTRVPVLVTALPVLDQHGDAILVVLHDLTEQRRVELQLRNQELLQHEAAELAHVGGWGFDPVTLKADWTPEVWRIHDLPIGSEPDLSTALSFYAAEDRDRLSAAVSLAMEHGTPYDLELRFVSATGTQKWVRAICRPIMDVDKVIRVRGSLQDITARKSLEEQFHHAQKMEAIGRLAGGVAHDFNNLLTVINGYAEMLLMGMPADSSDRSAAAQIRDAGERAAGLTAQMLAFSRKAVVAPRILDVRDAAASAERLLSRLIGEDVDLALSLPTTPCQVEIDPNQFDQVLLNLVVNARDAMPDGGKLRIVVETVSHQNAIRTPLGDLPNGRYVEVAVTDTGYGMTEEVKAKIFEPFFTTKEVGKGTGLGLAVVHGVVQHAGGGVLVDSAVGVGTTFRLLLPEAVTIPATVAIASSLQPAAGTETILLVEDEESVRMIGRIALESQGYCVLEAENGEHALHIAERTEELHLLVTDMVMPEMNGRELAAALRRSHPALRVLFVSGYTDDVAFLEGVRSASDAFLQKPFSPLGLARKVREMIDTPTPGL